MARGDKARLIREYWKTVNPIRKYEYISAHNNAAMQMAYMENNNPRNASNFYTDAEIIQYFNDRYIPLSWLEENCLEWWDAYQLKQLLDNGMDFLKREIDKK